ncbi:hypothetical protein BUALT_Bualt17G0013800 [Buddleja alternifolia]|uniref:Small auxin up regulated protein n=1 Tax=Buddleja alternifolia TaxID=168488 RepID=A0AAV6W603_9LAMI|nr:hypothetical protein BUALT_Bualt17G0013800 [Buddleja alternifolia]
MDSPKTKKGLISKTWDRCKSFSAGRKGSLGNTKQHALNTKSKSWPRTLTVETRDDQDKGSRKRWSQVAPEGCFSVYVGTDRQRFVIKTEYVNHPLFKMLLEEAESEYGYSSEGPLVLPCEVDHFIKVLMEMDYCEDIRKRKGRGCYSSYHLLTPPRFVAFE